MVPPAQNHALMVVPRARVDRDTNRPTTIATGNSHRGAGSAHPQPLRPSRRPLHRPHQQRVAPPTGGFQRGAVARWRAALPCAAQSQRARSLDLGPLGGGRQGPRRPLAPGARGRGPPPASPNTVEPDPTNKLVGAKRPILASENRNKPIHQDLGAFGPPPRVAGAPAGAPPAAGSPPARLGRCATAAARPAPVGRARARGATGPLRPAAPAARPRCPALDRRARAGVRRGPGP